MELQALRTLLSFLAATVQLNSSFFNAADAYLRKRQAIIRATTRIPSVRERSGNAGMDEDRFHFKMQC